MSLLHTILFKILMKNRSFYEPGKKDYEAARRGEIATAAYERLPKGVTLRSEALGGVPAESQAALDEALKPFEGLFLQRGDGRIDAPTQSDKNLHAADSSKAPPSAASSGRRCPRFHRPRPSRATRRALPEASRPSFACWPCSRVSSRRN